MAGNHSITTGTIIGDDFEIVRPLSSGGMGSVYVARQLSINVLRALKLMNAPLVENTDMRERFVREARIGAGIGSDHVVQVINAGVDRTTGIPWIAMELMEGHTLAEYLSTRSPLPQAEVTSIWLQLCTAIAAAHDRQIVHRDIKPENIFLARSRIVGMPFIVKVLDFGIAKLVAESVQNTMQAGSPMYMAPEQTSRSAVISQRTDVWSLGLIAFLLHTGKHFWRSAYSENPTVQQVIREAMVDPMPAASVRATEYGRGDRLPPGFDEWFARCVNREATERFPEAGAAGDALLPLLGCDTRISQAPAIPRSPSNPGLDRPSQPVSSDRGFNPPSSGSQGAASHARTSAGAPVDFMPTSDFLREREPQPPPEIINTPYALPPVQAPFVAATAQFQPHTGAPATSNIAPQKPKKSLVLPAILGAAVVAAGITVLLFGRGGAATPPPDTGSGDPPPLAAVPVAPAGMVLFLGGTLPPLADPGSDPPATIHGKVNRFAIDANEVTVADYQSCVTGRRCEDATGPLSWKGAAAKDIEEWSKLCNAGHPDRTSHPINCVTWDQAEAYCKSAGKRLPAEEEWELAARGGSARPYPWGDAPVSAQRANLCDEECVNFAQRMGSKWEPSVDGTDGFAGTAPIGSFKTGDSAEGLHDMVGNVAEWTSTRFCEASAGDDCKELIVRGGGSQTTRGEKLRKHWLHDVRSVNVGFRCATSL